MKWPEVYVLRHGETQWNAEHRMQGILNSPLTSKGEMQALRQREILSGLDLAGFEFHSSPQGRAFQTAALALCEIASLIRTDDRLREIGVGTWAGVSRTQLLRESGISEPEGPDGNIDLYEKAPGGEGFENLRARCVEFLESLSAPSVIVTHGITSRMLRAVILGLKSDQIGSLPGGQGNVFHLKDGIQNELT